jgi:hypothetical protein
VVSRLLFSSCCVGLLFILSFFGYLFLFFSVYPRSILFADFFFHSDKKEQDKIESPKEGKKDDKKADKKDVKKAERIISLPSPSHYLLSSLTLALSAF